MAGAPLLGAYAAISTTVTSDILKPVFGKYYPVDENKKSRFEILLNRAVIALIGVVSVFIAYDQIVNPNLSVAILAQNGVYAYFAAAFVPVFFGTFLKNTPPIAPIAASITAIIVHFTSYYLLYDFISLNILNYPITGIKNPAIPASLAIVSSTIAGALLYWKNVKAVNVILEESV